MQYIIISNTALIKVFIKILNPAVAVMYIVYQPVHNVIPVLFGESLLKDDGE